MTEVKIRKLYKELKAKVRELKKQNHEYAESYRENIIRLEQEKCKDQDILQFLYNEIDSKISKTFDQLNHVKTYEFDEKEKSWYCKKCDIFTPVDYDNNCIGCGQEFVMGKLGL